MSHKRIGALALLALTQMVDTRSLVAQRQEIRWPSPEFRTLQSAVDAAPDGGVVRISPGTYRISEPVEIRNKRLTIEGAGCTELRGRPGAGTTLVGPQPERYVVAEASVGFFSVIDGGAAFRGLALSGFDAGIVTRGRINPRPVVVDDICIRKTIRGVLLLASSPFTMQNSLISDVSWHGMSVPPSANGPTILLSNVLATKAARFCYQFHNTSASLHQASAIDCGFGGIAAFNASLSIDRSWAIGNFGPGIALFDDSWAQINMSQALNNRRFGILVDHSVGHVIGSYVWNNQPDLVTGYFGDGILAWESPYTSVIATNLYNNGRSGIATIGSYVPLNSNVLHCNGFDLDSEGSGQFVDLGNNGCGCPEGNAQCVSQSTGLSSPDPVVSEP
jgi:hypothetical protein